MFIWFKLAADVLASDDPMSTWRVLFRRAYTLIAWKRRRVEGARWLWSAAGDRDCCRQHCRQPTAETWSTRRLILIMSVAEGTTFPDM